MEYWDRILQLWQNKSITVKHRAGIGLLVSLMMIIASTGIISLYLVQKSDDAIRINTRIQRLIFEMDREMERARHLHAQFFLYYPQMGLQNAHEVYAQPSIRKTAKVISTSHLLRETISYPEVKTAFQESEIDLNLYLSSAKRFADTSIESFELATRLAAPGNGAEDSIVYHLGQLKDEVANNDDVLMDVHRMENFINKYRIERKRYFMQSAFNIIFTLKNQIVTQPAVNSEQKGKIEPLLDQIKEDANQILEVDVAIGAKFKDFILQEKAAHSVSEKLIALAKTEVARVQNKINVTQYMAIFILIVITLNGLIAAAFIAIVIDKNITLRIVDLTRAANKMRKGQLDVVAEEGRQDELGRLGKTFNIMTARIKGLVDNLEQEVRERTQELSETNQNLESQIHERRQAENLIKQKEEFLTRVIDQSPFAIGISDAQGTLERVNTVLKKKLNLRDEQLVGKYNIFEHPLAKRKNLLPLIRSVYEKGQTIHFTCDLDGDDIPTMDLKGANSVNIEATMFPIFDTRGGIINVVINWIDVSDKKRIEDEKQMLEQQLRQSHKMEAIGTLAGGIAHDFNNILGIMLGNAELALSDIPKWSPAINSLEEIITAGLRARDVVRQLLSFSRKTEQHQTPQDMGQIIKDALKLLRASIPSSVEIIEDIPDEPLIVNADATQLHQVILNLATNAAHAMEGKKGRLKIHLRRFYLEELKAGKYESLLPGDYVELQVEDTGKGMDPELMENIFDPYFTTKEFGKGTGMGLAVVHGIIKSHNASIHVESRINQGACFSLFFPRLKIHQEVKPMNEKEAPLMGKGNILFVDDDSSIVDMMSKVLEKLGYRVNGKTDPEKAIKEFYATPEKIDLVITDMTMPQMDGLELSRKLKQIRPDIPIIVCTGYSEILDKKKAGDIGLSAYVMKPVSMVEIGKKIQDVMGGAVPSI